MRAKLPLIAALVVSAAGPAAAQGPLSLVRAIARPVSADTVVVYVTTGGTERPDGLESACAWTLSARQGEQTKVIRNREVAGTCGTSPISAVAFNTATNQVEVSVEAASLAGLDLARTAWTLAFAGSNLLVLTPPKESLDALKGAEAKTDADLYFSGGFTGGPSSAPIWTVDSKVNIGWPTGRSYHWAAFSGDVALNAKPAFPADKANLDPDSTRVAFQMDRTWDLDNIFDGIQLVVKPIGGEYARNPNTSNVTTTGMLSLFSKAFLKKSVVLDPFFGFEVGKNLSKPTKLFDLPVDLSTYDTIGRGIYGMTLTWHVFQKKITPELPYRFVTTVAWQQRALTTDEPLVRREWRAQQDGTVKRQQVLTLTDGTRSFLEGTFAWNATRLFGMELKFKRGSLPPLFQYVDNSVALQFTFKAKFTKPEVRP